MKGGERKKKIKYVADRVRFYFHSELYFHEVLLKALVQ